MKTFVILSDSHGKRKTVDKIRSLFEENDFIVHLGDGAVDLRETAARFPENTYICKGNCDLSGGVSECVIEAEGLRIFCCHGHKYGVKSSLSKLVKRAKELDCEIALYGHTHRAEIKTVDGVLCINPGALGSYSEPSYCYLVIHNKKPTATIVPV